MSVSSRLVALALIGAVVPALGACSFQAPAAPTLLPVSVLPAGIATATPAAQAATVRVERGAVVRALTFPARVSVTTSREVAFTLDGVLKRVAVASGSQVQAGDLLAELEGDNLADALARAREDLQERERAQSLSGGGQSLGVLEAEQALEAARGGLSEAEQGQLRAISEARLSVQTAQIALERIRQTNALAKQRAELRQLAAVDALRDAQDTYSVAVWQGGNGPVEEMRPDQRAAVETAQRALERAQRELDLASAERDGVQKEELNQVALAEIDLARARADLEQLLARQEDPAVAAARRAVRLAEARLDLARRTAALSPSPELARLQRQIADLEAQIEATRIVAPISGVVASLELTAGQKVAPYVPVLTIVDPSSSDLVATSLEREQIAELRVGMTARITFDRFPAQPIAGAIRELPAGQDAGLSPERQVVRLSFPAGALDLTFNDTATVQVELGRASAALWLPPTAVRVLDQAAYVERVDGAGTRQVPVTVGIRGGDRVQILSGLKEGDEVLLNVGA